LDSDQVSCRKLRKHLKLIDKWASSDEMKRKLFGTYMDNYEYTPCNRGTKEYNGDNYKGLGYVKMKFDMNMYGPDRINRTMIVKLEGSDKRTIIHAPTMLEIVKEFNCPSGIKVFFVYNKFWVNKWAAANSTKMSYGIGIKVKVIEYVPPYNLIDNIFFLSSDDEESD
jgi:hypothetical protein